MGVYPAIAIAYGDGIGPEIMRAVLHIVQAAGAMLEFRPVDIGEQVYLRGHPTGIEASTWEVIRHADAFLKAPITTPQGGGFKSLNVTIRTTLGMFANIRPCVSYSPFITTKHPVMDVVVVRENEEDVYSGIEYRQTPDFYCSLKIATRQGTEKIIRYAFEFAKRYNRKKVTCFSKDNIMKFTDGIFHRVYDEIGQDYPNIEQEHWIVDIGAALLADTPEKFDVIVMPNLYGDILSDVAAQIAGSIGICGTANIGDHGAMFEAIHGSAPTIAGKNIANPSGLLLAAIMMLVHVGQPAVAEKIHNAWLATIEAGIHTADIFRDERSHKKVGTQEFAEAVVAHLGRTPRALRMASYQQQNAEGRVLPPTITEVTKRELVGIDVFVFDRCALRAFIEKWAGNQDFPLQLRRITNRGVRVWPEGYQETTCSEQWRCRFTHAQEGHPVTHQQLLKLLTVCMHAGIDVVKTEHLYVIDGMPGFSPA